jgi:hypothetical protein
MHSEVLKIVNDFRKLEQAKDSNETVKINNLSKELTAIPNFTLPNILIPPKNRSNTNI